MCNSLFDCVGELQLRLSIEDLRMMLDGVTSGPRGPEERGLDWETFVKILGSSLWF